MVAILPYYVHYMSTITYHIPHAISMIYASVFQEKIALYVVFWLEEAPNSNALFIYRGKENA